jgi:signal transduction histidine kinase
MLETARALSMVVDREFSAMQASATALATSHSLATGDLATFHHQMQLVLRDYPGGDIILADANGQQLVNSFVPFGKPLPKRNVPEAVQRVFETGKPIVTNLFKGALTGRFTVGVDVPVFRGERVVYDLALTVPAERFAAMFSQQRIPTEWPSAIIDGNFIVAARNRLPEKYVGTKLFPHLIKLLGETSEGFGEFTAKEGIPLVGVFSRSTKTGWTFFVGIPKAVFIASVWRSLKWVVFGVILLSITAVTLALFLTQRNAASIAERKRAEEGAAKSEERFRALVTASSDAMYRMSPNWSEMRQLGGGNFIADTEAPRRTWLEEYIPPDDQLHVMAVINKAIQTKSIFELEHRVMRVDGSLGWTFSRAIPLLDANGEIVEWFGAASDITERKLAEEALLRSEKLAATGRLAATIAHEVNNPLDAAMNAVYIVSTDPALSPEMKKMLALADQELRRAAHITQQTLGFYRGQDKRQYVALPKVIEEVVTLYARKLQERSITVDRRYKCGPCTEGCEGCFLINAGELRQIISNLLANGMDALRNNGTLYIRASRVTSLNGGGQNIHLTIADNGCGIRAENLKRIFEPFFTTKESFGTGLGLWVTQELVRKHNGVIKVRSRSDKGTVFRITFPAMSVS